MRSFSRFKEVFGLETLRKKENIKQNRLFYDQIETCIFQNTN